MQPKKIRRLTTQDEQLLESPRLDDFTTRTRCSRVSYMCEFVTASTNVPLTREYHFWFARKHVDDPDYAAAQETAALLSRAGFCIITGGGPGLGNANRGAFEPRLVDWVHIDCRLSRVPIHI